MTSPAYDRCTPSVEKWCVTCFPTRRAGQDSSSGTDLCTASFNKTFRLNDSSATVKLRPFFVISSTVVKKKVI